jgi:hypothetical protein
VSFLRELAVVVATAKSAVLILTTAFMNCFLLTRFPILWKLSFFFFQAKTIDHLRVIINETVSDFIEWISKEQNEHTTGLAQFVLYGPIIEICSWIDCLSRLPQSESAKIDKISQLLEVPSTCFKLTKPFQGRFLELKESIVSSLWNNRFDSFFAVSDSFSEMVEKANQDYERKCFMIDEAILSFDDRFCQFVVVLFAFELGVMAQLSLTLKCSKSMIEALGNFKIDSNLFSRMKRCLIFLCQNLLRSGKIQEKIINLPNVCLK